MLTRWPPGIVGFGLMAAPGMELPGMGRLSGGGVTDMSCWCGRDMPKPIEGVIFSQPWRAWPVKFDILCMALCGCCHARPGVLMAGTRGLVVAENEGRVVVKERRE
jgi:hypothetical protein